MHAFKYHRPASVDAAAALPAAVKEAGGVRERGAPEVEVDAPLRHLGGRGGAGREARLERGGRLGGVGVDGAQVAEDDGEVGGAGVGGDKGVKVAPRPLARAVVEERPLRADGARDENVAGEVGAEVGGEAEEVRGAVVWGRRGGGRGGGGGGGVGGHDGDLREVREGGESRGWRAVRTRTTG